jgi:cyclophilin family peptidyl-prolyl cis-trans isomerase
VGNIKEITAPEAESEPTLSCAANSWAGGNPVVFFEITIGATKAGRIEMELHADVVPKTVENFRCLCTGEMGKSKTSGKRLSYRKSMIHRVVGDFMCQGGDFTAGNGSGGESIYGPKMADENFELKHTGFGILSMANAGPNTSNSQFFITLKKVPKLDGKHVVFGKVLKGKSVVRKMEDEADKSSPVGRPKTPIQISECGQIK